MEKKMKKKTKAFIMGALTGVGIGILVAPNKGEVTRKKLGNKINQVTLYIKEMDSESLRSDCLNILNNIKDYLEELNYAKVESDAIKISNNIKRELGKLSKNVSDTAKPVVTKAVNDLRDNTVVFLKNVVNSLETKDIK